MARVKLAIADSATRVTLKVMLETDGHIVIDDEGDVIITDDIPRSVYMAKETPVLVLAAAFSMREAVDAMRNGVYGYIFMPLQPGEAGIMVRRATAQGMPGGFSGSELTRSLEEIELDYIQAVLRETQYNHSEAATILGIGRNTLWRKLQKIQQLRTESGPDQ
jgi:DNA-binding NtrC family response regulator